MTDEVSARGGEPPLTDRPVPPGPGLAQRAGWAVLDWIYAARWQISSLGPTTADDYRDGDQSAVVVIPGVYETWHFMRPLMDALHDRGHPVHVVAVLRHNVRPVPVSAADVMAYLVEHDLRDVVIVAHSKGGLIGKYAMTELDGDGRIDRMVAVSTPFAGSVLADLAPVPHLRVFRATDPVLAGLAQQLETNSRITSVYGVFDTLIPGGSELTGARNVRVPVGGHFRILGDPSTRDVVLDAVAD
ncbi:MAG: alpha/beta hydrolase [Curtobacterium sp.]|uniref:esterase/lipase family protein n=1 Tax=Curtobacterium sp. L3-7 TaxID=3138787 RepID=UPI0031AE3048